MNTKPICHRDGSITYWSTYKQVWFHRHIWLPDYELAAMPEHERKRIINHLHLTERLTP
jgi:hypothetical protein